MPAPLIFEKDSYKNDLKPLSAKQLNRLFDSDRITTLLVQLELHAYLDKLGCVRVGLDGEHISDHDRWLYMTDYPTVEDPAVEWWHVRPEDNLTGNDDLIALGENYSLEEHLKHLVWLVREVQDRALAADVMDIGPTEILAATQMLGQDDDVDLLVRVPYQLGLDNLHELIHHTAAWLARNPEFDEEIPRSVLLGMHGANDPYAGLIGTQKS